MRESDPYRYLCAEAASTLEWIERPVPERLDAEFYGDFIARNVHLQLLDGPRVLRRTMSLFTLRDAGRSLVHTLKYRNGLYLREDIAQLVRDCPPAVAFLEGATLVPVPLHSTRQRERGFNQSEVIAAALAEALGLPLAPLLTRVKATRTQTRLNREQREHNVGGAFALGAAARVEPEARYILVDDVFTTGATISECARVLREAGGAAGVDAFTLGHG